MYKEKKVSLVIPAYNESKLIKPTLESVPEIIDKVYVVDDRSTDNMADVVRDVMKNDPRVELIVHEKNSGPGQAIITGYLASSKDGCDIAAVCGGDHQMPLEQIS
ncbi:MAG: glycosyltransferase family 2 protein, partial [bacterium]|nr:glycosyltransferase family 2 protein [bacterium]